jgi:hypothetical protein
MTTGMIAQGQAALYVAETTSGKFAVYTMGQRTYGKPGVISRHDSCCSAALRGRLRRRAVRWAIQCGGPTPLPLAA